MQVTDMQNGEIIKCYRQFGKLKGGSLDNDLIGAAPRAAVESRQLESASDDPRGGVPIFEIEEDQSLAKKLCLVFSLNFESPIHMLGTNSFY